MSTRKLIRAIRSATAQILKATRALTRSTVHWLLRGLLLLGRTPQWGRAGFVLPATILVILVVLLTVGSITYRTYTRTTETITERQQRVIYNAATPAIDRARSKLEFLFNPENEPRYPGGVPSENVLMGLMLNGATIGTAVIPPFPDGTDPYTFADETRIDVADSGTANATDPDNAWRYRADTDGDGNPDATVVYSISMRLDDAAQLTNTTDANLQARAQRMRVRNTPLSTVTQGNPLCQGGGAIQPQQGWVPQSNNTSKLLKNFQVDAYVLPDRADLPVSTLEMQLDRQLDRGNKWGAWFRYDLEIFPGPGFNWNGAMHTEGSVMLSGNNFTGFMISDPDSCLYTEDASEVSVAVYDPEPGVREAFMGQYMAGTMKTNNFEGNTGRFDLWNGPGVNPERNQQFGRDVDSVPNNRTPADYAIDPVIMQTQGISAHRNPAVANEARPANWEGSDLAERRLKTPTQPVPVPYVDDTFRADNRYGPKPQYDENPANAFTGAIGTEIPNVPTLIGNAPGAGEDSSNVGLDGYWERRARFEGLRIIVGQRLELGDPAGWGGPVIDPTAPTDNIEREALKPFAACRDFNNEANNQNNGRCNEARQRRSLWDNLAAVQAMTVYHAAAGNPDTPVACVAATVHPGTAGTLDRSATFQNLALGLTSAQFQNAYLGGNTPPIISDFLRGRGTNGWEFEFNTAWLTDYDNPNSTLRTAMSNLANFAGDPEGGAPSFTPIQNRQVHPYPLLAMWGDQSTLRRVLELMNNGRSYAQLSPADKTTLHNAACTIGMLAYNLDYLEKFQPNEVPAAIMGQAYETRAVEAAARTGNAAQYYAGLRGAIRALTNGTSPLGQIRIVQPGTATPPNLNTLATQDANTDNNQLFAGAGVTDVNGFVNQPETYVRLLERWRDEHAGDAIAGTTVRPNEAELNEYIAIAQLIISKEQVARDRYWGFFGDDRFSEGVLAGLYGTSGNGGTGSGGLLQGCAEMDAIPSGANTGEVSGDALRYLCSWRPRYPSLFSLFPSPGFGGDTRSSHGDIDESTADEGARFVRDELDSADNYIRNINASVEYDVIPVANMPDIIATPRANLTSWALPNQTVATPGDNTPNNNQDTLIKVCFNNTNPDNQVCLRDSRGQASVANEQFVRIPFKESAFFNGREMLSVRTTDVNLNFIRQATQSLAGDTWLPQSGIVYAFREDAISEPHIVRPRNNAVTWTNCNTETNLRTTAACQMQTGRAALVSTDPPLPDNAVSVKPVDYYPDPDRRPNGFRLRDGADLRRANDQGRGLSFISDNTVYIQGNFNLHNADVNPEEEFTETAGDNFQTFYNRQTLNPDFARAASDSWRPSEVLADAITILSDNFCDGSMQDFILTAGSGGGANLGNAGLGAQVSMDRYGCINNNGNRTSYLNGDRLRDGRNTPPNLNGLTPGWRWMRTNVADGLAFFVDNTGDYEQGDSPIYVSPNGNPWQAQNPAGNIAFTGYNRRYIYNGRYYTLGDGKPLSNARRQRVNAIIVSGLVPSQANQSYGGLHNFPRFIENWGGDNLYISGSLVQLNFSIAATAPFDQDAWEVGDTPQGAELIRYYSPPNRRWGYDVGLQYAPAGPVAQRFIQLQPSRNEFYSEPPADDPYLAQLQQGLCASNPNPVPPQCP